MECFAPRSRTCWTPVGLFLLNLSDRAPFAGTRDVVAGLRTHFGALVVSAEPATLRGRRPGNVLVVAGCTSVPDQALVRSPRTSAAPYRVLAGADVERFLGGGTPRTDPARGEGSSPE